MPRVSPDRTPEPAGSEGPGPDGGPVVPRSPVGVSRLALAEYFDRTILPWEASAYPEGRPPVGLVGRALYRLRSSIRARRRRTMELLVGQLEGRRVVEIGCGSGHLAVDLAGAGAARVRGVDVSPVAVAALLDRIVSRGLEDRVSAELGDAHSVPLVDGELVIALGVLDYMDAEAFQSFLRRLRGHPFVVSFSESRRTLANAVHTAYLLWPLKLRHGGVRAYHHAPARVARWMREAELGEVVWLREPELRFGVLLVGGLEAGGGIG